MPGICYVFVMEKVDGRKVTKEVQQALRGQVIRSRKQGKKNKDVAEFLGISPPAQQHPPAEVPSRG
ncbi:MAG: hypothetical protein GXY80_02400 [Syntrophorhabdus aromaticivorans]|uniref:Uncharacterized protein n=1 Tax=Syntrophorhabdus aromaticivorans TaxID=328301 RepID=A0A971RZU2_9BACT|nr:hypothetical protein [Syntrophorhabdus aromaticivorans]